MKKLFMLALSLLLATSCSRDNIDRFDENHAYDLLKRQCEFGSRVPGTEAHRKTREFIIDELKKHGVKTSVQEFTTYSSMLRRDVSLTNIIGTIGTPNDDSVMLSAHWDSRPIADKDADYKNRETPISAANDGASGVAVLLEFARVLSISNSEGKLPRTVILAFFDGEDLGIANSPKQFCFGSKYMSLHIPDGILFAEGINLDMVGGKEMIQKKEGFSHDHAETRKIQTKLWEIGTKRYPHVFKDTVTMKVIDDHYPFIQKGIPYVNIVDMQFPHWHTLQDTPDNCSPESLNAVGEVVLEYLLEPQNLLATD